MPDVPEKTNENEIPWSINERGDLLIDGVVVEKNQNFQGEIPEEEDESVPDRKNAVVEGEDVKPEVVPAKEPEEVKPAETSPGPVKITEKQKFKLMVRGEFQEKEYTNDELIARLQMAESYGIRNDELREKHKKIEPFLHVFDRPDFKEWLESKVQVGEIQPPSQSAPPANEDVIRYRLRAQEPEFGEIRSKMVAWAATLPDSEAEILNNSHKAFVDAYDHFKSTRKTVAPAPAPIPTVPNKVVEKAIAAKEVIKAQARVEGPGDAPQEVDPGKEYAKEERRLKRAVQGGEKFVIYNGQRMPADVAWVMHRTET